jgi:Hemerythrin HHE cation binding domain
MSTKSAIKAATSKARQTLSAGTSTEATDILDTLKREHREVQALLKSLQNSKDASERTRLVKSIKAALVPHTKAEEKVVYDAVISTAEVGAETDGYEGYLEHEWASKTLERLEAADPLSSEHKAAAKVLKELVDHHIKEEEGNVWRDVREHFDAADRVRMNEEFEEAKRAVAVS